MDVDGTMTDGSIYLGNNGEEFKAFNIHDGYGIAHLLPKASIVPIIITGKDSTIVKRRASELGITELYQGVSDKLAVIKELVNVRIIGSRKAMANKAHIIVPVIRMIC